MLPVPSTSSAGTPRAPRRPAAAAATPPAPAAADASSGDDDDDDAAFSDDEGGFRIEGIYVPPPPRPALTTEDVGPRLIILRMVHRWFKSYAGKCIVGPFHKRFNAVIGPNGSGKSNVIDAMLFVFGYRASRIRSKKVSNLIHNSERYQRIQSCTVEVHFAQITDGEGDSFNVIPGSEFNVARTANKDNSSYYELNGKRVQFKEIALVLRGHGIDLDNNRFLILQGEIEQISLMKSKAENPHETGMLEYLEDIIGTRRYKQPLEQLTEKNRELADKRSDRLARLKLVDIELEKIKGPMEEAVAYLQIENDITTAKNVLLQAEIQKLESNIEIQNTEKQTVDEQLDEIVGQLRNVQAEQDRKKNQYDELSTEYNALAKTRDKCKKAFDKLSTQDIELQAEMEETNKTRKKMKKQLEIEQKKKAELDAIPEKAEKSVKELQSKEAKLVAQEEQLENEKLTILDGLKDATRDLQQQRDVLQEELVKLRSTADEAKSALTIAESRLELYTSDAERARATLAELEATGASVGERAAARRRDVERLRREAAAAAARLGPASAEAEAAGARERELAARRGAGAGRLESARAAMRSTRSRGRVLDTLARLRRDGRCDGFFGRLGDLGGIDQKYDIAVSTACGPLDHIVVDTVDTAQWCIEYLKEHNIGHGTFLALDKQEHLKNAANSKIQTPENVPRLFDLIRIEDDRLRPAFYFAVRDTLVAADIEQASRIAFAGRRRHRVVTLAGQMIEASGAMSGGGRASRGRMGRAAQARDDAVAPAELERLEREQRALDEELAAVRRRRAELDEEVAGLRPRLRRTQVELDKFKVELESLEIQEPQMARQIANHKKYMKEIQVDQATINQLIKEIANKKVAYDAAEEKAGALKRRVDVVVKEINERTTGKVDAVEKRIQQVQKTLDEVRNKMAKDKVSIGTAARNAKKCADKIAGIQRNIAEAEDELKSMKAKREEIDTDGAEMMKHLEGFARQLELKEDTLKEMKTELAALSKQENEIKKSKIEVDAAMQTVTKSIDQLKTAILVQRQELSKLKYHETPDRQKPELKTYTKEELATKNLKLVESEIAGCKKALQQQNPNFASIQEYKRLHKDYLVKSDALKAVTEQKNKLVAVFDNLKSRRKTEFLKGFRIIRHKLKEMYQMITLGGDADLELIDSFNPFSEGVKLNVRPPRKPWKNITNLSGGEKTLTSLALVFALHYYKPSPLYVMDEIDAALDFKNVSIVAHYIKERTKNAQFVIISLRPNMFELANYLIGIHKVRDCTSATTLDIGWRPPPVGEPDGAFTDAPLGHVVPENVLEEVPPDAESMEVAPEEALPDAESMEVAPENVPEEGPPDAEGVEVAPASSAEPSVSSNEPETDGAIVDDSFAESQPE